MCRTKNQPIHPNAKKHSIFSSGTVVTEGTVISSTMVVSVADVVSASAFSGFTIQPVIERASTEINIIDVIVLIIFVIILF